MLSAVVNQGNIYYASRNEELWDRSPKRYHTNATYHGLLWKDMSVLSQVAMLGVGMRKKRT
jgi:hypothetical protein